jgi:DNA (cytosine-5)-methyltransferase 1
VRPRLLDLYCCAGGAAVGYYRAGFDVVGVDIRRQVNYPQEFHQGDALEYLDAHGYEFEAIHASPPCQDHSKMRRSRAIHGTGDLLGKTRRALIELGIPWVIENVPGAPMRSDYKLCGCMFDLPGLRRERWFETSWHAFEMQPPHHHTGATVTVAGHTGGSNARGDSGFGDKAAWERAMGIGWMTTAELAQAIPPAYTQHIGERLMDVVRAGQQAPA